MLLRHARHNFKSWVHLFRKVGFSFFLEVKLLQKSLGEGEWDFQVDSVQFVTDLLILTNKSSISTILKWLDL